VLQQVVSRLPPSFIRAVGRAQFRSPLLAKLIGRTRGRLNGVGIIRHGVGAGLRFDSTGGYPGYLLGTSEPEEQSFLANHLSPGDVFYDLGANVGFYSTIAAHLVGPTGRVYAFEPHPTSAKSAARNAALNDFTNVTVVPAAVSNINGRTKLALSEISAKHKLGDGSGLEVDVVSIDQWSVNERAPGPSVVMIDVEGAELLALDGMRATLREHKPVVCCEVHWLGARFLEYCRDELGPLGYELANLVGAEPQVDGHWHAVLTASGCAAHG
jgi:FkbM family methyltransferase